MKSLTPKQRGEIYLKAANRFSKMNAKDWHCTCPVLQDISRQNDRRQFEILFPEWFLFKPASKSIGEPWWWTNNWEEDVNIRIICMLLCYEIAKDSER